MRFAALIVLLLAPSGDDESILGWIRELEDDAPAVRERAAAALLENFEAAEPWLQRAVAEGAEEQRGRAADLLRAIVRKRLIEPAPSRIGLHAEGLPLRDALVAVAEQTLTPIDFTELEDGTLARPVTVSFDGLGLFDALDAVVRAHGEVRVYAEHEEDAEGPRVLIEEGAPTSPPRKVLGPYELTLDSIELTRELVPGAAAPTDSTLLSFSWCCERGVRPLSAALDLAELKDDQGGSWAAQTEPAEQGRFVFNSFNRVMERGFPAIPPEPASRFTVVRGALVVLLPTAIETMEFLQPASKLGAERRAGAAFLKLLAFSHGDDGYETKVEIRPRALAERLKLRLLDAEGKPFDSLSSHLTETEEEDREELNVTFIPESGRAPATLSCIVPTGTRERRIPFDFRDVRFR